MISAGPSYGGRSLFWVSDLGPTKSAASECDHLPAGAVLDLGDPVYGFVGCGS